MNINRETDPSSEKSDKVYCIRVTRGNGPMDPQLAAAMQEIPRGEAPRPEQLG